MSSQGRSGAHFYRTEDGKFLIKCLSRTDVKALRGLLADLYAHITRPPSTSLLAPPLALFKVDHQFPKSVAFPAKFFLITRHIAPDARLILDLKGCLLHRRATTASLRNPDSAYHVLKDRDILESRAQLVLAVALRSPLLSQLSDDLEFLKDRGIIDYSLLLAMTTTGKKRAEKRTEEAKAEAHRVLIKSEWEVIEEEEEVVMRHTKEEDGEVEQEQAERDVTMNVEEEGAKEAAAEIQEDAEDTDEKEEDDNVAGMPVRLRINSFVNSTLAKPHAVLQDLSDVNPGSLRLQVNIIDYLTHYGVYHRMSGFVKHLRYGANVSMSTEPPTQYRFRLQAFAEHVITSV